MADLNKLVRLASEGAEYFDIQWVNGKWYSEWSLLDTKHGEIRYEGHGDTPEDAVMQVLNQLERNDNV